MFCREAETALASVTIICQHSGPSRNRDRDIVSVCLLDGPFFVSPFEHSFRARNTQDCRIRIVSRRDRLATFVRDSSVRQYRFAERVWQLGHSHRGRRLIGLSLDGGLTVAAPDMRRSAAAKHMPNRSRLDSCGSAGRAACSARIRRLASRQPRRRKHQNMGHRGGA